MLSELATKKMTIPNHAVECTVFSQQKRLCSRRACSSKSPPQCCLLAAHDCARGKYTKKWHHLSRGEHVCNECFQFFSMSNRDGYAVWQLWQEDWTKNGNSDPDLYTFLCDQWLPYWLRCRSCGKWREIPATVHPTSQQIAEFTCESVDHLTKLGRVSCKSIEDERAVSVSDPDWIRTIVNPQYLEDSPASPYLTRYRPETTGLTASVPAGAGKKQLLDRSLFAPFLAPCNPDYPQLSQVGSVQADAMTADEIQEFPEFRLAQRIYLGVRNLVLLMWNESCKDWLTADKCEAHMICRGLIRVRCYQLLRDIIQAFSWKSVINFGLLDNPPPNIVYPLQFNTNSKPVIVIGAGIAGLSAARFLKNSGLNVVVLEARKCIGGRILDPTILYGFHLGLGATHMVGCRNNPFTYMAAQAGLTIKQIIPPHDLVLDSGRLACRSDVRRMEFCFNQLLENCVESIVADAVPPAYKSLSERFKMSCDDFLLQCGCDPYTPEEYSIMEHHLNTLAASLGGDRRKLSSLSLLRDCTQDSYRNCGGRPGIIVGGLQAVVNKMADGINVMFDECVSEIDYGSNDVSVISSGKMLMASRVLVTVPLCQLKKKAIHFSPELPTDKVKAIEALAVGQTEKLCLVFPTNFWSVKVSYSRMFGYCNSDPNEQMFSTFFDMSPPNKFDPGIDGNVLVAVIHDGAVDEVKTMLDVEVVQKCMKLLRRMFPEQAIYLPTKYILTRWYKEAHIEMSTSYLPSGAVCQGDERSTLARNIHNKIFFAGEATSTSDPNTVVGAFNSSHDQARAMIVSLQEQTDKLVLKN